MTLLLNSVSITVDIHWQRPTLNRFHDPRPTYRTGLQVHSGRRARRVAVEWRYLPHARPQDLFAEVKLKIVRCSSNWKYCTWNHGNTSSDYCLCHDSIQAWLQSFPSRIAKHIKDSDQSSERETGKKGEREDGRPQRPFKKVTRSTKHPLN